jgi:hypothetical protein
VRSNGHTVACDVTRRFLLAVELDRKEELPLRLAQGFACQHSRSSLLLQ